eukprot:TRINITY_DN12585_c0_g1_i1.p1 TRINITY_DN12585_c0_g1~~TRINITY_DN12585_c0_g1_i1.p1  ORF type:complete len:816 (+),score=169.39 TRINITY_DN12585_c0_g1_i1:36-2483(+)
MAAMIRLCIHSITCQQPSEKPAPIGETIFLRLAGPAQATRSLFLGEFCKSEKKRLTRITHIASGPVAMAVATSPDGSLVGLHTVPSPRSIYANAERHILSFTSRETGAHYNFDVRVAHVRWLYSFTLLRVLVAASPIPCKLEAEVEFGCCPHDTHRVPVRSMNIGSISPGRTRSVGDGLNVSFTTAVSASVGLLAHRFARSHSLLGAVTMFPLDDAETADVESRMGSTQGGLMLRVNNHDELILLGATNSEVRVLTFREGGRAIEVTVAFAKQDAPPPPAGALNWPSVTTSDNSVLPLVDGQTFYAHVAAALQMAQHSVCISAWDMDLDAPLIPSSNSNSVAVTLEDALLTRALAGVNVRLLIWRPMPYLPTILCPIAARVAAMERRCRRLQISMRVQVASVRVPTGSVVAPLAEIPSICVVFVSGPKGVVSAHHEKIILLDAECLAHTVAFVGGFDIAEGRFDTQEHVPSAPGRPALWALRRRLGMRSGFNWHDIHLQVRGPVTRALYQHFVERWVHALSRDVGLASITALEAEHKVQDQICYWHSEDTGSGTNNMFTGVAIEVVRAWPGVVSENSMLNTYIALIQNAQHFVYIENQYALQAWPIASALVDALLKRPELRVIVIAPAMNDLPSGHLGLWLDASQDHMYEHLDRLYAVAPDRVGVFTLLSKADSQPSAVYVHSKVLVMDDQVVAIGSANMDNISLFRASELLLVCRDARVALDVRKQLCQEHLGPDWHAGMLSDFAAVLTAFVNAAKVNSEALCGGRTLGRVAAIVPQVVRQELLRRVVAPRTFPKIIQFPLPHIRLLQNFFARL